MRQERRVIRSEEPGEALELYLEATAQKTEHRALTLVDESGDVFADAPGGLNTQAIAAVAPLAQPGQIPTNGLLDLITRGENLKVCEMEIQGQAYYLAAVGDGELPQSDIENALTRILTRVHSS